MPIVHTSPLACLSNRQLHHLVIILPRLLFLLLLLLLLALLALVPLFGLELLLPHLVCRVLVEVGEDNVKDFLVPGYGAAFDAFFDVLGLC